jgi:hypothetical protein
MPARQYRLVRRRPQRRKYTANASNCVRLPVQKLRLYQKGIETRNSHIAMENELAGLLTTMSRIEFCEAGRLTIAQHFSAGIQNASSNESARRTAEILQYFSRPFHGLQIFGRTEVLGFYQSSAWPTNLPETRQFVADDKLNLVGLFVDIARSARISSCRQNRKKRLTLRAA